MKSQLRPAHVKGRCGHPWNELPDALAARAAKGNLRIPHPLDAVLDFAQ